jgi:two-component system sensor histidine kinase/response regulator
VLGLIDNILLWAKTQAGTVENKPEDLNINGLIAECIDILSPMASEKDITLVNQSEDISLQIDHNLLSASIRNLISNAIKFSNEGSSVVIKAEQVGDECQISVIDDGIGIEPERVIEIMDGGTSSTLGTSKEKGSGLGLRITKELIAMTGGNLTAESQWGKGSVFTISLPSK